jgi:pimeloyl-ACP methyl ester carboxylesterase
MREISFRKVDVDGFNIFYREAGPQDAPVLLLLHGFPSASHMFRDLIPQLSERFRLVAPDLLGFGQSDMPERTKFSYTFDNIAGVIDRFTEVIGLTRFAIYVFDYGAPTGFRLAMRHPERITAIISQNGNAYVEGLSDGWNPIRAYWQDPSEANRAALRAFLSPETTLWQYTHGVADTSAVSPDGYSLDNFYLARSGADEVQLDLFGDYKSNVALYLNFQACSASTSRGFWQFGGRTTLSSCRRARRHSSATFRVRKCISSTGHFALETHCDEIAAAIRDFLAR